MPTEYFLIYLSGVVFSFLVLPFFLDEAKDIILGFMIMCLFSWIFPVVVILYISITLYIEFANKIKLRILERIERNK